MKEAEIEVLWIPEKERLEHWLDERIRFRETSIFSFDDGQQIGEAGLMRRIQLTNAYKLRRIAKILDKVVTTTSYSNLWWEDSFEYNGYNFCSLRRKER